MKSHTNKKNIKQNIYISSLSNEKIFTKRVETIFPYKLFISFCFLYFIIKYNSYSTQTQIGGDLLTNNKSILITFICLTIFSLFFYTNLSINSY